MVELMSATSLLGNQPLCGSYYCKDVLCKQKPVDVCWLPCTKFLGRKVAFSTSLTRLRADPPIVSAIKSQAMELTKEACSYREQERIPHNLRYQIDTGVDRKPGLWPPENKADKPSLHNPLLQHERVGCGWLGAIFEWEGVLIEDNPSIEKQAWLAFSQEERKSPPPSFIL